MKLRLSQYGFEDGDDFRVVTRKSPSGRGRPRTDYLLSRDMAKELAMVENNEIGRKTRRFGQSSSKPAGRALGRAGGRL